MKFWKYQGAGNDFILLDQRENKWLTRENTAKIAGLCDRHFGIGADGLIVLEIKDGYDFQMIYFNADGRESTMCGNGGRCIAAFARQLGIIEDHCRFWAIDGEHEARLYPLSLHSSDSLTRSETITKPSGETGHWVELKMSDVQNIEQQGNTYILNTGSPHFVRFEDSVENLDVVREGRSVRYSERFKTEGINVNFVSLQNNGSLAIRTYERGVENETLACGTGVTAAALASWRHRHQAVGQTEIPVHARGGNLAVRFQANNDGSFSDVWLCGPAQMVFKGEIF